MRKLVLLILTWVCCVQISHAQQPQPNLDNCGYALQFDGVDDWADISNYKIFGDFTLSFWVKLNSTGTKYDGVLGQEGHGMDLNFYGNKLRMYVPGSAPIDKIVATTPNIPGVWVHYAITRDGNNLSIYRNGILDKSVVTAWSSQFEVKALGRGNMGFLDGDLDRVSFWDKALSIDEISALRCSELTGSEDDLIAAWEFDGGMVEMNGSSLDSAVGASFGEGVCCKNVLECGYALEFDGKDDWVNTSTYKLNNDFTIAFWVKLDSTGTKYDAVTGMEGNGMDINFNNNLLRMYVPGSAPVDKIVANTPNIPGLWTHYAIVRDGSTLSLYRNGELDKMVNTSWSSHFEIKDLGWGNAGFLDGSLDKVSLWDKALSASGIDSIRCIELMGSEDDLLAVWDFNGGFVEPNGSSPDSANGAQFVAGVCCEECDYALSFDGVNDWMQISNYKIFNDFTIAFWVKLNNEGTMYDGVVGFEGHGYDINFYGNKLRLYIPGSSPVDKIVANTPNTPDEWVHYAVVRDGSTLKIYRNGSVDNSVTTAWSGHYEVHAVGRGNAGFLNGSLDKISFWDVALSTESVNYIMCGNLAGDENGLIANWDFYGGFVEDEGNSDDYEIGATFKGGVCCATSGGLGKKGNPLANQWYNEDQRGFEIMDNKSDAANSSNLGVYPNPFSDYVNISFEIENETSVNMQIIDITGKTIKDYNLGMMAPGTHTERWNGDDNNGHPASGGLYFFIFRTSDGQMQQSTVNLNR